METAYNPAQWSSFFAAEVSAAAALTGLLFVSLSINLQRILGLSVLVTRAGKALISLFTVMMIATFCLVPGQSHQVLGGEIAAVGTIAWVSVRVLQRYATHKNSYITSAQKTVLYILSQAASLPFVLGGVSLIRLHGGGLYWLLVGVVASFLDAVLDAWVLLIEIQR